MIQPPPDSSSGNNRLDELAEEFVQRHQRGERPTLSEYTERHPDLADQIRELFPALVLMQNVQPQPGASTGPYEGAAATSGVPALERLGDYRILREVGRGGMGIVYEAEQESLGRHVALKVLPAHALLDPQRLQRFQREARAAARLHHTNIVPVYGVGEQDGLHYYVMQFIQGLALDEVLGELRKLRQVKQAPPTTTEEAGSKQRSGRVSDVSAVEVAQALLTGDFASHAAGSQRRQAQVDGSPVRANVASSPSADSSLRLPGSSGQWSLSESGRQYWQSVARIGIQVAEALAYAHGQGTLHRDIKPSNLLLDTQGTVWVTDFGLAKAADSDDLTDAGDFVGTLRYMAPERFQGKADPRSDLYALGLTLYELLTLRPAFQGADRNQLLDRIRHEEPPPPRKLNGEMPRDLETIVLKALAKEPAHRYATAVELAEDLKRFVEDKPIRARRVGSVERLWRWCRRNPAVAGLLATVAAVLLLGTSVAWTFALQAEANAEQAQTNEKEANDQKEIATQKAKEAKESTAKARQEKTEADKQRLRAEEQLDRARRHLFTAQLARVEAIWERDPYRARELLHEETACPIDLRDFAWRLYDRLCQRERLTLLGHTDSVHRVAFSSDGQILASGSWDNTIKLWDVKTGKERASLKHAGVRSVAFSSDGQTLASGSRNGTIKLWDVQTAKERASLKGHTHEVLAVAFSCDGLTLASCGGGRDKQGEGKPVPGEVKLWDVKTGKALASHSGLPTGINAVAFSSDGQTLASGSDDKTIKLWDVKTGQLRASLQGHKWGVSSVAFSSDGRTLASGGGVETASPAYPGEVKLWGGKTGQESSVPKAP
jgi:serine/threonine protein kinase